MTARRLFGGPDNVLARVNRLVMSGMFIPPVWYDTVRRTPPLVVLGQPHPGRITFPEDRLYPALYKRIPELQDEALYVTSPYEATVGRRVAQRWSEEIERTEGKDEEKAWGVVMQDEGVKGMLAAYQKRLDDGKRQPITAGNISRFVEKKMQSIGVMRKLGQNVTEQRRKQELERALDIIHTGGSSYLTSPASTSSSLSRGEKGRASDWDELTEERKGLLLDGRQWTVPDMTNIHQLRFILAPANPELNAAYHQQVRLSPQSTPRSRPIPDNTAGDNTLHWALSHAVVQHGATLRDWIAYCLRVQVLVMRRYELLPWIPYTNCIDYQLWRQARVVLRCRRVDALEGEEMQEKRRHRLEGGVEGKEASGNPAEREEEQEEGLDGVWEGRPLVYHVKEGVMGRDDRGKHALLLSFIDDALARHRFSLEEMKDRAPPPPPPRVKARKKLQTGEKEEEIVLSIRHARAMASKPGGDFM